MYRANGSAGSVITLAGIRKCIEAEQEEAEQKQQQVLITASFEFEYSLYELRKYDIESSLPSQPL